MNRDDLIRDFSRAANGHQRQAVIEAAGIMVVNAIRQNRETLSDAEAELDLLYQKMRLTLREKHYLLNGKRRTHEIEVKMPPELVDLLSV